MLLLVIGLGSVTACPAWKVGPFGSLDQTCRVCTPNDTLHCGREHLFAISGNGSFEANPEYPGPVHASGFGFFVQFNPDGGVEASMSYDVAPTDVTAAVRALGKAKAEVSAVFQIEDAGDLIHTGVVVTRKGGIALVSSTLRGGPLQPKLEDYGVEPFYPLGTTAGDISRNYIVSTDDFSYTSQVPARVNHYRIVPYAVVDSSFAKYEINDGGRGVMQLPLRLDPSHPEGTSTWTLAANSKGSGCNQDDGVYCPPIDIVDTSIPPQYVSKIHCSEWSQ